MDIRKLQKIVVAALEDIKGEDIEVIDTRKLTALFDRIIIATGNSNRQTRALARNVHDKVREAGGDVLGIEGEGSGEWVLIDLGDIVVHVMLSAVRSHYNLEELWQAAPKKPVRAGDTDAATKAAKTANAAKTVKTTKAPAATKATVTGPAKASGASKAPRAARSSTAAPPATAPRRRPARKPV